MTTIEVKRDLLFDAVGESLTDVEVQQMCSMLGLDLYDTSEKQMLMKEQDDVAATADASEEIIYRIKIPDNCYNLVDFETLVDGILVLLGKRQKYIPTLRWLLPDTHG
ncbi:phenylalanine--tRNA ligase beta subunit-like isoform X2 [Drosophila busckii]|uniref:phenylalanine--tRNA ligase beta subunit-like isoform X2 n=1 Tax=Drosophila busckii TaxID=30019 RepID=UPI001432CD07|nr:phenylalanine--tRNA ligase beta subunit-like isoform X2 [Drosophila busckii]